MKGLEMKGSLYQNGNRWWWKVKLPGESNRKSIPLKPIGARFATKDKAVAREVAKRIWQDALDKQKNKQQYIHTIRDLTSAYYKHCKVYYQHSREAENIKNALDFLEENTDVKYAQDFKALDLKRLREAMIKQGWARSVINKRVNMIKRMFKWAASEELVPITNFHSLWTVENLKPGRSKAKETKPIKPVPEKIVYDTMEYMSDAGKAMVELQLFTGMRSSELCNIRPVDIDTTGKIWQYQPEGHKTAFRGHTRIIYIGPEGQKILKPFLNRKVDDYCFKPSESHGQKRNYRPKYDRNSYRRMIKHAITAAGKNGKKIPHWHPHQLRHTAGTKIRKEFGRDAARAFLGHKNPSITDDYAEIDLALGKKAAEKLG